MLPRPNRLTGADAFRAAIKSGRRAGSATLAVHFARSDRPGPARVGFVVSRAVGNAVDRNLVKRRLRHLTRGHLAVLPGSTVLVVRANPAAAGAPAAELAADLDRCLERVLS